MMNLLLHGIEGGVDLADTLSPLNVDREVAIRYSMFRLNNH
jgi:hypothetical protein